MSEDYVPMSASAWNQDKIVKPRKVEPKRSWLIIIGAILFVVGVIASLFGATPTYPTYEPKLELLMLGGGLGGTGVMMVFVGVIETRLFEIIAALENQALREAHRDEMAAK